MGLNERLARYAAGRPRPFVIAAPGATRVRLSVEAEFRRRGWRPAVTPIETGLLIICGEPGAALGDAIETVWRDTPGPRARMRLPATASYEEIATVLDGTMAELADLTAQRADALSRVAAGPWAPPEDEKHAEEEHQLEQHRGRGDDHDGVQHGGNGGHSDHGGHEHHMGSPSGLAMAERADDRDGLKLDALRVPLGPVLPHWPAGLQVSVTLQGDVVQAAEVEALGGGGGVSFWDEPWLAAEAGKDVTAGMAARRRAAAHLDSMTRLLAVAGWPGVADRAGRLRDDVLAGRPGAEVTSSYAAFARRTGRSRLLRWMIGGIGRIDGDAVARYGLTGPMARYPGDVAARLRGWLTETGEALSHADDDAPLSEAEGPRGPVTGTPSAAVLAVLPALLEGTEFSVARLIVASLDPDLDQLAAVEAAGA